MRRTATPKSYKPSAFFSSRRRHTRLQGDWSSDVCSSDLYREFVLPLLDVPPPNSIPQIWLITMFLLAEFLMVPTKAPVVGLKPLITPLLVLLLISSVPLSTPKFSGATANPHGWFSGLP